jgi:hypothetical protein
MSRSGPQSSAGSSAITNDSVAPAAAYDRKAATAQLPPSERGHDDAADPREHGGREGPDPTRFGDWEKGGRCIDF